MLSTPVAKSSFFFVLGSCSRFARDGVVFSFHIYVMCFNTAS